tara:strand:- start:63514 stop:63906 length:393 start_codon:yes stop_codon:yes gene_type:complete
MIKKNIIFYDAYCALCDKSITWILENDNENEFQFCHFKSDFAKSSLKNNFKTDSVSILTVKGEVISKSDATIFILYTLKKYRSFYIILKIIPKKLRDFFYDVVAKNRYQWFGKFDYCKVPSPKWKEKFIE